MYRVSKDGGVYKVKHRGKSRRKTFKHKASAKKYARSK